MLMGIRLQAHPNSGQKLILSQWMGCARFIWNAKCEEDRYLSTFAKKYLPIGVYAPIDQKFSQYKDDILSPWLSDCPSQILPNSVSNWFQTYKAFLKGECGKPKRKPKSDAGSIHLTNELFRFETCDDGVTRLFVGTKTNNIGYLSLKNHGPYQPPKSIHIKRRLGQYFVSFCYEDPVDDTSLATGHEHLNYLRGASLEFLNQHTVGIDRGIVRPVQAGAEVFDLTPEQKRSKTRTARYLKRLQRRIARQKKGSNRRRKIKGKIGRAHLQMANIRRDFCHKASHAIVSNPNHKVIILEDLKTKNMTKAPKPKQTDSGHWEKNGASAKAGLNRQILDQGWHQFETFLKYKSFRAGKALFKVSPHMTSQECAACSHTHPGNRQSQASFVCGACGHTDHADRNAAEVIKKRAIVLILDSGSELSSRGVLLDSGRGATVKTRRASARRARGSEASKKRGEAAQAA